jgi:AhpD family alkylhydroperoxidase
MTDFLPLVEPDDLPDDLRAQWAATSRGGLQDFVRLMAHAPDHFRRYNEVYGAVRFDNHLGIRLTELVRLTVAQTTRCPVCMAGRLPAALELGVSEQTVAQLAGIAAGSADTADLTEAEAAAVVFSHKFATDHLSITDADKSALRAHLDPEQVVELALLCVLCLVGRFSMLAGLEEHSCAI